MEILLWIVLSTLLVLSLAGLNTSPLKTKAQIQKLLLAIKVGRINDIISGSIPAGQKRDRSLTRAIESIKKLRKGVEVRHLYSHGGVYGHIDYINHALENGHSYEDLGTTEGEIEGFKNGESQRNLANTIILEMRKHQPFDYPGSSGIPDIDLVYKLARKGNFSLEDLGTSRKETRLFKRQVLLGRAQYVFRKLKKASEDGSFGDLTGLQPKREIREMMNDLSRSGHTLEDLGTSVKEIESLVREGWLTRAHKWFEYAVAKSAPDGRIYEHDGEWHIPVIKLMRESLAEIDASLEDIGLTEADIEKLMRSAHVAHAGYNLVDLRSPGPGWFMLETSSGHKGDPERLSNSIQAHLSAANATLEEIDSDQEEIERLVRRGYVYAVKSRIEELKQISKQPRRTKGESFAQTVGNGDLLRSAMLWTEEERDDLQKLGDPYDYQPVVEAIKYFVGKSNLPAESMGASEQDLHTLTQLIEAR